MERPPVPNDPRVQEDLDAAERAKKTYFAKDILKLKPNQLVIFEKLYNMLLEYLRVRDNTIEKVKYNFTAVTWVSAICRMCADLRPVVNVENDCWLSNQEPSKMDNNRYPRIKVKNMHNQLQTKNTSQGARLYAITSGPNEFNEPVTMYKLAVVLCYPKLLAAFQVAGHALQTAHRCAHFPQQRCFNPNHLIPLISDAANKDMIKCFRGTAASCPGHGPEKLKCIYTSIDGCYLICKNELCSKGEKCVHIPNCHTVKEDREDTIA